jgi:hypothetical protein
MRKKLKIAVWVLFFLSATFNLLAWGGLGLNREFGPRVLDAIPIHAPLALLYVHAGRAVVSATGMGDMADRQAERWFGGAYPQMRENPAAAVDHLFGQWSAIAKLSYYGCLLTLLVGLYLSATTPQPLRTFGGR